MAQIYFGLPSLEQTVGSTFELGVFLDGQGQPIAAVESQLVLSDGLEIVDIRDGNSTLSLWLERPQAQGSTISFSGVIPGGFSGERGELFTVIVKATKVGEGNVASRNTQILLNDGQGTPAEVQPAPIAVSIIAEGEPTLYQEPVDIEKPEVFTPMLLEQPALGGWVVVFSAQDKGSGIDYYEVREGRGEWQRTASPWLLQDQDLHHAITVKAVDKSGNERLARLSAPEGALWYESLIFWGIIGGVLVALGVIVTMRRVWGKRLKR